MTKGRLEAFSDGLMAIIITIMVLEFRIPDEGGIEALKPLLPKVGSYIMSFVFLAIYWNNHHHMMHTVKHVNGGILWANLHLFFWLSLVPFATGWMGENNFSPASLALYGIILLMAAIAYFILQTMIIRSHGKDSLLAKAIGKDVKGKISPILYLLAIGATWINSWISGGLYILVALIWLVPDKRIEIIFREKEKESLKSKS